MHSLRARVSSFPSEVFDDDCAHRCAGAAHTTVRVVSPTFITSIPAGDEESGLPVHQAFERPVPCEK